LIGLREFLIEKSWTPKTLLAVVETTDTLFNVKILVEIRLRWSTLGVEMGFEQFFMPFIWQALNLLCL
jgi:hypothetical protein